MKSYSFYFNASDWLASPSVKMMSKAERGVYISLLALAWENPVQGTLPASADKVRRLAEMSADEWVESGETLLEKFPLSECGTYRYNPRLLAEAAKEQARSQKAKESANKRWQSERNANASTINANASETPCERNAQVKDSKVKNTTTSSFQSEAGEGAKVESVRVEVPQVELPSESSNASASHTRAARPTTRLKQRRHIEPEHFEAFYESYPRKENRKAAAAAFGQLAEADQLAAVAAVQAWFARRADWIGPRGEDFRPHPATWLNNSRWKELANPVPPAQPQPQRYASTSRPAANGTVASLPASAYNGVRPGGAAPVSGVH